MIIEFSLTNFRSIKDKQTFSMEALNKFKELPNNVTPIRNLKILKTTAIYGKNASGKSNLLLGLYALQYLVRKSRSFKVDKSIPCYEPFKFDNISTDFPAEFEIVFVGNDNMKYKYYIKYIEKEILEERLHYYPKRQQVKLFSRKARNSFETGEKIGNKVDSIINNLFPNQLLLSKIGTEKVDELIPPFQFFDKYLYINIPNQSCNICDKRIIDMHTSQLFENKDSMFWENINKFLQIADTGIKRISIKESKEEDFRFPSTMTEERRKRIIEENRFQVETFHNIYDSNNSVIGEENLALERESSGTNRLLAVGGLLIDALSKGTTFVLDELERSLHPYLTKIIIQIFNDPRTNPNNAQLIFATHDISILNSELFRRDQIWFTEKDEKGVSTFYSLGDLNGVRKDVPFHKYYLKGLFGGIPNVNFYDFNFNVRVDEPKNKKHKTAKTHSNLM